MLREPTVKICCIGSVEEALLAARHGADAVGLVSWMPSGPGVIPEPLIAEIAASVPAGVETVLLTSRTEPDAIVDQQKRCGVHAVQLCDRLEPAALIRLRAGLPRTRLIQTVQVTGPKAIGVAEIAARHVDALLLDSGNPDTPVKVLGGTGRVHDWNVSRRIVEEVRIPVVLAGGLHARNVGEAVRTVGPAGVDVCSGVRTGDALDPDKLRAFVQAVRSA